MSKKLEILEKEYYDKYPCSKFEFSDLGDNEHYLPIELKAMSEYAVAFSEWTSQNAFDCNESHNIFGLDLKKGEWILASDYKEGVIYTTEQLLEIFDKTK